VPAKTESDTGKIFPASDQASDVLSALVTRLNKSGCELATEEILVEIERAAGGFNLVTSRRTIRAEKILLATGGKSYPACGTTGDGYRWAATLGHTIVPLHAALAPVVTHAPWVTALQGITIPDVLVKVIEPLDGEKGISPICRNGPKAGTDAQRWSSHKLDLSPFSGNTRCLASRRGSFLFTHFGVSGPAVQDVSRAISGYSPTQRLILQCDFLPGVGEEELDATIATQCASAGGRQVAVVLDGRLPRRLADTLLEQAEVPLQRRAAELTKSERRRFVMAIKQWPIPVAGTMGFRKAEVTAGGVALDEVDSRNMQSKIVPGLFFAGELLDLDGPIGGYNFQAAFSTGYLAGESM